MTSLNNVHLDKEQVINTCDDLLFEVENPKPNKELLEAKEQLINYYLSPEYQNNNIDFPSSQVLGATVNFIFLKIFLSIPCLIIFHS